MSDTVKHLSVILTAVLTAGCQSVLVPSDIQYPTNPASKFTAGNSLNKVSYFIKEGALSSDEISVLHRVNFSDVLTNFLSKHYVIGEGNSNLHIEIAGAHFGSRAAAAIPGARFF